ncbi:MAG: alpha/beta hydrolase [Desulfosarcinaceae bacterium]
MAILKPLLYLLLAGGFLLLAAYLLQEKLIFYPQKGITSPQRERYAAAEIRFDHEKLTLHGWLVHKNDPPRSLLVYYGGNAEEVSLNLGELDRLPVDSLLLMNYRGYGLSQGRPSEASLVADAVWVLDTVARRLSLAPQQVILMGRSLGTGVAVQVAARRPVAGLVLVTPFDSLVSVARKHYPFLPAGLLLRHRFDSLGLAPQRSQPTLFLVAGADEVIPNSSSLRLSQAWGGEVRLATIAGAGHNDIHQSPRYWEAIRDFVRSLRP